MVDLEQLAASGVQLDCYLTFTDDREPLDTVAKLPGTRVISVGSRWRWNRWYSRSGLTATVTGLGAQALGRRRLVKLLVNQHKRVPYDVVYQFSTIESFGRRTDKRRLPPVVLHPSAARRRRVALDVSGEGAFTALRGVVAAHNDDGLVFST